jgi:outer membrane lipoprotein SlyB
MRHAPKKMNMPNRSIRRSGLWMSVCLLAAATGSVVTAEEPVRPDEGKVVAIEIRRAPNHKPVNGGALIGGVAGGVIGHQIGSGSGNTAATIAGAIGGAVVGNEIAKKQGKVTRYRITVRLDSGSSLIVEDQRDLNLRVGDRVRVEDGRIHRI